MDDQWHSRILQEYSDVPDESHWEIAEDEPINQNDSNGGVSNVKFDHFEISESKPSKSVKQQIEQKSKEQVEQKAVRGRESVTGSSIEDRLNGIENRLHSIEETLSLLSDCHRSNVDVMVAYCES